MNMTTSPAGIAALVKHEGIVPGTYLDSVGVRTYGIGHTKNAGAPDPATLPAGMPADLDVELAKVVSVFKTDLKKFEARVNEHVKVPLAQHEFDALVSFDFNTGGIWYREQATGKWRNATLVDTLNAGNRKLAGQQFMNWKTPASIIGRRQEESDLFLTGKYPTGNANVWQVDKNGKVIWKPVRTLTPAQILTLMGTDEKTPAPEEDEEIEGYTFMPGTYRAAVDETGALHVSII